MLGLLFSEFFELVLVEADGCVGGSIMDVAGRRVLGETTGKATHYRSLFQN